MAVLIPQVFLEEFVGRETIGNGRQLRDVLRQAQERKRLKKDLTIFCDTRVAWFSTEWNWRTESSVTCDESQQGVLSMADRD